MTKPQKLIRKAPVGLPRKKDDAPNAFNDNEMSDELLTKRLPEDAKHAGFPRGREPRGQ